MSLCHFVKYHDYSPQAVDLAIRLWHNGSIEKQRGNNEMPNQPSIYVSCLASYNDGRHHGKWIEIHDFEQVMDEIQGILKSSPQADAEEWEIHDRENIGGDDYADIKDLCNRAEFIKEHGDLGLELLGHFCGNVEDAESAMDCYHGSYDSEEDFATALVEDIYMTKDTPKIFSMYFDYEMFTRDLFINDYYSVDVGNECHVFSHE